MSLKFNEEAWQIGRLTRTTIDINLVVSWTEDNHWEQILQQICLYRWTDEQMSNLLFFPSFIHVSYYYHLQWRKETCCGHVHNAVQAVYISILL